MLFKYRNKLARAVYNHACRGILATPPLSPKPGPLIFCSMMCERDLEMYLVAIKSVYTRIGEGNIYLINDGTLTPQSIGLLNHHLSAPTIVDIASIGTGPCPRGGTWERLLHILDLSANSYVIQVDSDILARQDIAEVVQYYRENRSFTLGTSAGRDFKSLMEAAAFAKATPGDHVQMIAERSFERLKGAQTRRYVRGCSGFAGFARGAATRAEAEEFSTEMEAMHGKRWSEWGTEQVTSSYLIANCANSCVLPWPRYANFSRTIRVEDAVLLHYIGDSRFYRGQYVRDSRREIAALNGSRP
jgi:hypothetical protein